MIDDNELVRGNKKKKAGLNASGELHYKYSNGIICFILYFCYRVGINKISFFFNYLFQNTNIYNLSKYYSYHAYYTKTQFSIKKKIIIIGRAVFEKLKNT